MPPTALRQLAAVFFVVIALLGSSCSGDSSDSEPTTTTSDTAAVDAVQAEADESAQDSAEDDTAEDDTADDSDQAETDSEEDAGAVAETDDTEAADAAEADGTDEAEEDAAVADNLTPSDALLAELSQISFGVDPTQAELDCMQVYFTYELADGRTDFSVANASVELDDQGLRDLAYASNGCVNNEALYGWAAGTTGVTGDDLTNGPACFENWFGDETWGDTVFHSFTALTYQYRLDVDTQADLINSLIDCAPVRTLNEFFAQQAESSGAVAAPVNRDCLYNAIDNDDASLVFWQALVEGTDVPVDVMAQYVTACTTANTGQSNFTPPDYTAVPDDFAPFSRGRQLATVEPSLRNGIYAEAPAFTIDQNGNYEAVLVTGGGEVRIELFAANAPNTVNNFIALAMDGYYDGLGFHRVINDFMAQGGDPSGLGTGGPGYSFADEFAGNPPLDRKGILAMANAGPDTNGSQFFITTAPTEWLNGAHTVFGMVVSGQEYIDAIAPRDPASSGFAAQIIESITIYEN